MNKTFKKITASIMAVTTLAINLAGFSANATSASGNYSTLESTKNGSAVTATLTVKSNVTDVRYGQVSIRYMENGSTTYYTNEAKLSYNKSGYARYVKKSANHTYTSIEVAGTLYANSTPNGTPCDSLKINY